jgi:hypothetical protein
LSAWSRDSHAADGPSLGAAASHSATSVDLPKPTGAEISVSFDSAPRLRRSRSFGRATRPFRSLGMWSLVSSSGLPIAVAPRDGSLAHGGTRRSRSSSLQSRSCLRLAFLPNTLAGIPRDEDVRLTGRRSVPVSAGFTAPDPASCGADVDSITLGAPRTAGGIGAAQRAWVIEGADPEEEVTRPEGFRERVRTTANRVQDRH